MKIYIHENWEKGEFWWGVAASRIAMPIIRSSVYLTRGECVTSAERMAKLHGLEVAR